MSATNEPRPVGRPTFRIDPDRLRGIREEKSFSQAHLIALAHEHRGSQANEASVKHYQRIERTGKTSQAMASALAAVLGTTVAVLQGEAPEDEGALFIDRLEQHIAEQLAGNANPALAAEVARYGGAESRDVAIDLAHQIESARFDGRTDELMALAQLVGWSVEEVSKPVTHRGHWLISSSRCTSTAEVVFGTDEVGWRVARFAEKHARFHQSDGSVTLREALPKLFVEIQHPYLAAIRLNMSLMRCVPSSTGLHWVNPSWRDRFFLNDSLRGWAYRTFNFVTDFDGLRRPTDVRRLRLVVEELGQDKAWRHLSLVDGDLADLHERTFQGFQAEGSSHDLVLNWLIADAASELKPLFDEWPVGCWEFHAYERCICLHLNVPLRISQARGQDFQWGQKYRVDLVEEMPDGALQPAPWREASVAAARDELKRRLTTAPG
ncbi:hypothetical protein [Roseateles sp.]|uniref:hypothetical protein n=1 Tax=Roseateles sp. TaxID=1971397 RepID=UPI0025E6FC57|nr:hypothetical protein [Roseateles sp.]MBV8035734.1 hypothetical protein [Roseateles sp.]